MPSWPRWCAAHAQWTPGTSSCSVSETSSSSTRETTPTSVSVPRNSNFRQLDTTVELFKWKLCACVCICVPIRSAHGQRNRKRASSGGRKLPELASKPGHGGHIHQPQFQPAVPAHGSVAQLFNHERSAFTLIRCMSGIWTSSEVHEMCSLGREAQVPELKPVHRGGYG